MALNKASKALLAKIVAGTVTRVTQAEGTPLLENVPQLIEVNTGDVVDGKALCRATQEGINMINDNGSGATANTTAEVAPQFAIISNAVLPPRKRAGRGGAPTQYPFEGLEIGQSFFVPVSAKHPNPVKTLASTISAQNMKYSEKTGATTQVERTKRGPGNKAALDAAGNKVKEMVTVDVKKATRKFSMRKVTKGETYGEWTADSDGVLIARVALD